MDKSEVLKTIENLRGRKAYEEKRAAKFGFSSLYEYIEDKINKKSINADCYQKETKSSGSVTVSTNKKCSCC